MNYTFTQREKMVSYTLMGIGLVAIIASFVMDSHEAWANLLISNFFFMAIGLFAMFFLSMQFLSQAGYGVLVKRVPEAFSQYLLVGGPLMLIIVGLGGYQAIYHWMHITLEPGSEHYDKIIAGKSAYLNIPFFMLRSVIYVGVWGWCAHMLRKYSLQQDLNGGEIFHKKSITMSVIFVVFFAVTTFTSSWDWYMSIDAHWYSTLYGWYVFVGEAVIGIAFIILFVLYLKSKGMLQNVNENHIGDLGKWMFAISLVWSYLWLSQFLLIWYANIPEEVAYYQYRIENYKYIFFGMLAFNFIAPFFILASKAAKRNSKFVLVVAVLVIIGHYMDLFQLITPGVTSNPDGYIGLVEVGTWLGFLGLFLFVVKRSLAKASLQVESHPYLEESLHLHH
ncbi:MAG: quinol:cytochrome C oxidoreductase [Flavobacteriales bacterium]|nr:quinol:cytochrome C oxidoreductase [Flavobacteriales bacterium]